MGYTAAAVVVSGTRSGSRPPGAQRCSSLLKACIYILYSHTRIFAHALHKVRHAFCCTQRPSSLLTPLSCAGLRLEQPHTTRLMYSFSLTRHCVWQRWCIVALEGGAGVKRKPSKERNRLGGLVRKIANTAYFVSFLFGSRMS